MPLLTKADLATHLYGENIEEITRGTDTIVETAIAAAEAEAKSYLSRYDVVRLFDTAAAGYIADVNLHNKVKDLACWHLVKLANPNINLELFRTSYEDAVKWLEKVQAGKADPAGWPYRTDDTATGHIEGYSVEARSNDKRNNHW